MRLSCSSDGVIIAGGLNWWGKKDPFCLRLHLSSIIISEKNINLEMDKWLENSDHPLSECGVLAAELFMESLSPPENLNILCAQFSRGWGSVLRQKYGNWTHLPTGPLQNLSSSGTQMDSTKLIVQKARHLLTAVLERQSSQERGKLVKFQGGCRGL